MEDTSNTKILKYSEDSRLDLEFRQILCVIKQFIPYVTSNINLTLYRCWLEKLSTSISDKANRNVYLIELAKQIKENTISPPFDQKPQGPLKIFVESDQNCIKLGDNDAHRSLIKSKNLEEDSSWLDLTDTSRTSFHANPNGCGDADENCDTFSMEENPNLDKFSLKYTNFIPADWKETIEALQLRLTETLCQNDELKRLFEAQNEKLSYELAAKENLEVELENCKKRHEEELKNLKEKEQEALKKLQTELRDLKTDYEMREAQHDTDKITKDREIIRLSEMIQRQCTKMSNEIIALRKKVESSIASNVFEEKILVLRKCVSKMDKLYSKSEKEYLKQIEKLKQELSLRDKMQLVQLSSQRAELAMQSGVERQKRTDEVINNLEVKYIKMLEYHERQVSESKRLDDERLKYLRNLLEKNNIPFKVF